MPMIDKVSTASSGIAILYKGGVEGSIAAETTSLELGVLLSGRHNLSYILQLDAQAVQKLRMLPKDRFVVV
jgi:hypothetical protein